MQQLIHYTSQTAVIQLPHVKYVDWLIRRNCFEELIELFRDCDSPTKEISESYSAWHQMKKLCKISEYNWLHIGDGSRARTGALFTLLCKTDNMSIDPDIRLDLLTDWITKWGIRDFYIRKNKFEDIVLPETYSKNPPYNITCVHAHIDLEEVDKKFPNWKYLYSSICCYPSKQKFSKEYMENNNIIEITNKLDMGIISERREFIIYKKEY
jgi:hypothetical protein